MASAQVQQLSGHSTSFELNVSKLERATGLASAPKSHDVATTLNYYKDPGDGSEPLPSYVGKPETYVRPSEPLGVTVRDIRGEEDKYTLDGTGFQVYRHVSAEKDFLDEEKIKREYYAEVEQLLKDATGASRVFIFDHTIRSPRTANTNAIENNSSSGEPTAKPQTINLRGPVNRVHIDQSYKAARSRVPHHLPEEAESLLKTRHQIINVWRPIKPIVRDPLAVADALSVPDSDLVTIGLIYPNRKGETYAVRPNVDHRWFYLHGQTPAEVLLIKCYDSKLDGRARRVPHTAFVDEKTAHETPRESIEVRALVFHEDQIAE